MSPENAAAWQAFREAGLLWWINRTLHLFGWAIVFEIRSDARLAPAFGSWKKACSTRATTSKPSLTGRTERSWSAWKPMPWCVRDLLTLLANDEEAP